MSYFSTQFIVPTMRLTNDQDAVRILGRPIEDITDFGIGEPCLFELMQGMLLCTMLLLGAIFYEVEKTISGLYTRRGCFVACDIAK